VHRPIEPTGAGGVANEAARLDHGKSTEEEQYEAEHGPIT
jgi:hypothetical protein